jgi:probable addiction module antidote protein
MPLNFRDDLLEALKDPKEAEAFLDVALEEDDLATFFELLRILAKAKGGMTAVAKRSHLRRETLYKMLSEKANPSFRSVLDITKALGYHLRMAKEAGKPHRHSELARI